MRPIFLLACLAISAYGAAIPSSFNQPPASVPEELKSFNPHLSEKDTKVLGEIFTNHNLFQSDEQALDVVEANREQLYRSSDALASYVQAKTMSLQPEAKEFIDLVLEKLSHMMPKDGHRKPTRTELREDVEEVIDVYEALSDVDKENLKTTFPKITQLVN
ncbi:fatty acid and retinol binding protein, partial [Aphelenchoides avenae]